MVSKNFAHLFVASVIFVVTIVLFCLVDDDVVIEIVKKHVLEFESKGKSWIV